MSDPTARPAGPLRILVVDADDRVRESLTGLLAIGDRLLVIGSSGQAGAALDLAADHHPDVVIVDPRLPEMEGGLHFIAKLRAKCPDVRILAMSWSDAVEAAVLVGGADGFVHKTYRPTEMVAAIEAADRRAVERSA